MHTNLRKLTESTTEGAGHGSNEARGGLPRGSSASMKKPTRTTWARVIARLKRAGIAGSDISRLTPKQVKDIVDGKAELTVSGERA